MIQFIGFLHKILFISMSLEYKSSDDNELKNVEPVAQNLLLG